MYGNRSPGGDSLGEPVRGPVLLESMSGPSQYAH